MTDEEKDLDKDAPGPTGAGIEQAPRGNPDTDDDAVEKGEENLERVKPY